ncbi:hypothetical protein OAT16_03860 [Prolixibacteraceae bacterium]|nr:hypothetical protein [Prolixibacteraceae bacterium]
MIIPEIPLIKNKALFILMMFVGLHFVEAQEKVASTRHFYTSANGVLYVPQELPMFLFITSDTISRKDMQRLKSISTSQYTNPFYFGEEGKNTISSPWAVDPKTRRVVEPKKDVTLDVIVDGSPPKTRYRYAKSSSYYRDSIRYFGKGVKLTLTSTDKYSGVKQCYYSINAASFQEYGQEISSWIEGGNKVQFYAIDNVGYEEKSRSVSFVYDSTPPKTSDTITGPIVDGVISVNTALQLSSVDSLSGVYRTYFSLDHARMKQYVSPITFADLEDGEHTISWKSEDRVKNMEAQKSMNLYLDRTAPQTKYAIDGDLYKKGKVKYISSRTKLSLIATDNKAGVKEVYYNRNQTSQELYRSPLVIEDKFGKHSIAYWSKDKVENTEKIHSFNVFLDNRSPITRIDFSGKQVFKKDTLFIGPKSKCLLLSKDRGAGWANTQYVINDQPPAMYNGAIELGKEGFYSIKFHSMDKVNNSEVEKASEVFVDATPPMIYINFSVKKIGETEKGEVKMFIDPMHSKLYVSATDKHAGEDRIEYAINKGRFQDYAGPQKLDATELGSEKDGRPYILQIRAYDKLGNMSEKQIEFYVNTK